MTTRTFGQIPKETEPLRIIRNIAAVFLESSFSQYYFFRGQLIMPASIRIRQIGSGYYLLLG